MQPSKRVTLNGSIKPDKPMPDKDINLWGLVAAVALGVVGGAVRIMQAWRGGQLTPADYRNAAIDLFGSAFITVVVYLLTLWGLTIAFGENEWHEVAAVGFGGVAGHVGVRASILALERYLQKKLST